MGKLKRLWISGAALTTNKAEDMKSFPKARILELLSIAEKLASTDPEAELAARMFRSLLEPPKPRDLLREEIRDKMSEYALAILDEDAYASELANDIRCLLGSRGLRSQSVH